METLLRFCKFLLVVVAVGSVVQSLITEGKNHRFVWSIWKRFRIKIFLECIVVLILTITAVFLLWQIPFLKWSWMAQFFDGGGNIFVTPVLEGTKSTYILIRFSVLIFFVLMVYIIPFWAHYEENAFRKGHYRWKPIIKKSISFGLVHCFVGVPIAVGIAMIISGLFYGLKYKRSYEKNLETMSEYDAEEEAVMVTTTYHSLHNTFVVLIALRVIVAAI